MSPANPCLSTTIGWIAAAHGVVYPPLKALRGGYADAACCVVMIPLKVGEIQVLGLALSIQRVGSLLKVICEQANCT